MYYVILPLVVSVCVRTNYSRESLIRTCEHVGTEGVRISEMFRYLMFFNINRTYIQRMC